jgi:PhnB protein
MPDDTMTEARPDAELAKAAYRGVIPALSFDGQAAEAASFYSRAFGAQEVARMPFEDDGQRLMHVALAINGGGLMMSDCVRPGEAPARPAGFTLQLVVGEADGDAWWSRAVEAGCKVVMPFEKMFWGDRWGLLEDPFGVSWGIDAPAAG